jgi:hypothetical protein
MSIGKNKRDSRQGVLRNRFLTLYENLLKKNNFFDKGPVEWPPLGIPNLPRLRKKITEGSETLLAYHESYFDPLLSNLKELTENLVILGHPQEAALYFFMTTLVNTAIQLGPKNNVVKDVHRLRAVSSDILTSYLYSERRNRVTGPPLHKKLPPLGAFVAPHPVFPAYPQPYMLEPDQLAQFTTGLDKQFKIGTVSLPSGYINHPILWGVLAHEIGGHDVLHADDNLVEELQAEVRKLFDGGSPKYLGPLWSHWTEEAASDVCGVLNIGPAYGIGAILYYSVILPLSKKEKRDRPLLLTEIKSDYYRNSSDVERHPAAVVIPDLVMGATDELNELKPETVTRYNAQLQELAKLCTPTGATIKLAKGATIQGYDGDLPTELNVDDLRTSARRVGRHLARVQLPSLKHKSLKEIETWDDDDEKAAARVADKLQNRVSLEKDGADDAQILAGSIFAILRNPDRYDDVNNALRVAFEESYEGDPLLGKGHP